MTTALILAGGFGSRLASVVSDRAKPAAIVNCRPFIHYLFDQLRSSGCISEIVVCAGIKAETIIDAIDSYSEQIKITPIIESKPLGTGGAIRNALLNTPVNCKEILVVNGDSYVAFPMRLFIDFHRNQKNKDMSMVLIKNYQKRLGPIMLEGERVVRFLESSSWDVHNIWKNAGIYYFTEKVLKDLIDMQDSFSIENDYFVKQGHKLNIRGFFADANFIDIGVPEDFKMASEFMGSEFI